MQRLVVRSCTMVFILIASVCFSARAQQSIVTYPNNADGKTRPYSEVVSINLGNAKMLIISGQVALNEKGELVGQDNIEQQTIQVFENLKKLVEKNGGNMSQIVKTGIFLIDLNHVNSFRKIRAGYFDPVNPPASTLVGVTGLYRKDLLIEIEAIAVIPNK